MRKRRLASKMLQKEVAEQLGVKTSIARLGGEHFPPPEFRHMPAIIRLIGYNPLPDELLVLAKYWMRRVLEVDYNSFLYQQSGSGERVGHFAMRRVGRIELLIGSEVIEAASDEVQTKFESEVDPELFRRELLQWHDCGHRGLETFQSCRRPNRQIHAGYGRHNPRRGARSDSFGKIEDEPYGQ
jgi:hypothetical protein